MTAWTQQEMNTLHQNMHLPSGMIQSVIPTHTKDAIRRQRNRAMGKAFPDERATVVKIRESFMTRRWSQLNISAYIRACKGCVASRNMLETAGLWYK